MVSCHLVWIFWSEAALKYLEISCVIGTSSWVLVISVCWSVGRMLQRDFQTPVSNGKVELKHSEGRLGGS